LHHWDVEIDGNAYWEGLPEDDKSARLRVNSAYWESVESTTTSSNQPRMSERALMTPFSTAYIIPHNEAIKGGSDAHAEVWDDGSLLEPSPVANPDFFFVYDGKLTGVIELKTWWKVTENEIEEVKDGKSFRYDANRRS
jgi:hypothetical protein